MPYRISRSVVPYGYCEFIHKGGGSVPLPPQRPQTHGLTSPPPVPTFPVLCRPESPTATTTITSAKQAGELLACAESTTGDTIHLLKACPFGRAFFLSPAARMLRIALPNKGRLAQQTRQLFGDADLVFDSSERALTSRIGDDFLALFLRAQDIPEFVADGAADLGVTGLDLLHESGRASDEGLVILSDLGFGACRLVVAIQDDDPAADIASLRPGTRVASAFPRITRNFFEQAGVAITLVPVSGAAEVAPHLGVADAIVDITSTGSTLRQNGLRELATVLTSSAQLIAGPTVTAGSADKRHRTDELKAALDSVLTARGKRYLMANVPRAKLADVSRILPGLNGPTVIDIMNGGDHVAVHAVVDSGSIYRTIADLKSLGAEGILVTRIERLMA